MTIQATLHTSEGDIEVELYDDRAPRTVENFVNLAEHDPAAGDDPAPARPPGRTQRAARCGATPSTTT